jgi:hypothetical protein
VVVVDGLGGREAFEITESVEGLDKFLGVAENGDEVGLGAGTGSYGGFSSWPSKRRAGFSSANCCNSSFPEPDL